MLTYYTHSQCYPATISLINGPVSIVQWLTYSHACRLPITYNIIAFYLTVSYILHFCLSLYKFQSCIEFSFPLHWCVHIIHIVHFLPATISLMNGPISVVQRLYYSHACRLINTYYIIALYLPVLFLLRLMSTPYNWL